MLPLVFRVGVHRGVMLRGGRLVGFGGADGLLGEGIQPGVMFGGG